MDVVIGATPVVVRTILKLQDSNKVWRVSTNSKRTKDLIFQKINGDTSLWKTWRGQN